MKTVIMAGGKGTRITSVANNIPKPMIQILGKPVLEYEIENLRNQGFTNIILTVSHMGQVIMNYFGDGSGISPVTGVPFGVNIEYYFEEKPLGNAGALFYLRDKLLDDFLLLNADVFFDVDFKRFVEFHERKGGLVTLFTHPNNHPYDSGIIISNSEGVVQKWITKEDNRNFWYNNQVNAGLHILSPDILDIDIFTEKVDLDRQILKPLAGTGKMFAYKSPEYVKDMGTPDRYNEVYKDFIEGKVIARNLKKKQKAIFLDRDGTINQYVGFLTDIKEFVLIPGVSDAIRTINQSEYLVVVVSNQPVIARGEVSIDELNHIHDKMETLLGQDGAYLDAIYYCPHHPDRGFVGERLEYKIECECRKPKPGMLIKAAKDFNIDLSHSWMIGDSKNDVIAGKAAGCQTILIGSMDYGQDLTCFSLGEAINSILK